MRISVVVPARNAGGTIEATLAALAAQQIDEEYEVIVVDSGSRDETPAIVQASGGATLLRNPGGEPAGSRNLGARHGSGAVLAFTDADCQPTPDWLAAGHRALARADIVQGRVTPVGEAGPFDRTLSVESEYGLYETANLFVTREAFDRVGGFQPVIDLDHGRVHPFGEDAWFVWRARRAGARTAFARDAVVRHAVFPRGAAGWISEQWRCRHFPALVRLIPELRRCFLHRRLFLSPSSLRFDLALVGLSVALGRRQPLALAALAPYVSLVAGDAARRGPTAGAARVAADLVTFLALLQGSVADRSPVF